MPGRHYGTGRIRRNGDKCKFLHDGSGPSDSHPIGNAGMQQSNVQQSIYQKSSYQQSGIRPNHDLMKWTKLLDQSSSSYSKLTLSETEDFFKLGASLTNQDQDNGTVHKVITLLADENGLKFIRYMIEHHIQNAKTKPAQHNVWARQIRPLFTMLSRPHVADSAVLEQPNATIRNYIVGVGGRRFEILYEFLTSVLEEPVEEDSLNTLHADLESASAVLSCLIDSSTSNIVNEKFTPIALRLEALIQGKDGENVGFSLKQAQRYVKYIQQRLGVGENLPSASEVTAKKNITRANFVLDQDFPGSLSQYGQRHDNDHAEIFKIKILPTSSEILSTRSEYYPTTNMDQSHTQGSRWLADRNFRLLREDTIGQLRDIARTQLDTMSPTSSPSGKSQNSLRKIYRYTEANLLHSSLTLLVGCV